MTLRASWKFAEALFRLLLIFIVLLKINVTLFNLHITFLQMMTEKFTQKSHPTKMRENCCPAAKHEGNWVTWNLNFECNLDTSVNGVMYRSRTLLRLVSLYLFSEFLWQFMHGNHLKMTVWIDGVLKRKCCFQMCLDWCKCSMRKIDHFMVILCVF